MRLNTLILSFAFAMTAAGCANSTPARATATTRSESSPAAIAAVATSQPVASVSIASHLAADDRWKKEIDAYMEEDATNAPPKNAIVFVGSSSIRGWRTLKDDFAGLEVIGRGFGGSHLIDVIRFTDVLVIKHRPRIVVLYAGENDMASRVASPQDVARHFQTFVDLVHRELPDTRILYISAKPSPSRFDIIDRYREANRLIESYIATDPRLTYVDVFSAMLDEAGKPREELYVKDRLHMTPAGFAIWTKLIRPLLESPTTAPTTKAAQ